MAYILSLDQGTTSSRSILFGKDGNILAQGQREFKQIYPQGGWVEHDPYDILTSQMSSVVEVLGKAGVRARDLAAIGITNQRETTIVWDRETGKPVYNAIVWQDRRTAERCNQLNRVTLFGWSIAADELLMNVNSARHRRDDFARVQSTAT